MWLVILSICIHRLFKKFCYFFVFCQSNKGWNCYLNVFAEISDQQSSDIVYIRNEGHTVLEAIERQMAHYAYHVGQIVHIGRLLKGDEWEYLSIPKGQSDSYNHEKFNKEKDTRHFTERI